LLVNTGTPAEPRSGAVRRFLAHFLSDPRVVELPRALWLPLLYGLVLPLRAPRSAHRYRLIWQSEGSPLRVHSAALRSALERALPEDDWSGAAPSAAQPRIDLAFLYSEPSVGRVLEVLRGAQIRRLLVLPLFPQVSGTTTGAVYDQVGAALHRWRTLPELRLISDYHDEPLYIASLAESVREHWQLHGQSEAHLLISFHGIPESYVRAGDAYADQCRRTAALLAAQLQLPAAQWTVSFQSRFGAARWIGPATSTLLTELPQRRVRAVTVICPGFAADCLETLEEIDLEGRAMFLKAGGERFDYVPALNARPQHVHVLATLLRRSAADWWKDGGGV
jgi:ferrochelatase